jgi:hypothetical protein
MSSGSHQGRVDDQGQPKAQIIDEMLTEKTNLVRLRRPHNFDYKKKI